ncbi:TonB-dependent receptor [Hydrogenophilus thiooxidans]|uniref:TonB-dependent receptor n=1 Tax=Hydrogenophilus thiooxidans TaxID=2820326 RepID=UPI001C23F2CD|nr:TonB-dependent receptor [Hydrogenophilus thiooxidans]
MVHRSLAMMAALLVSLPAVAASSEVERLRAELDALKAQYERRLADLEARLAAAEAGRQAASNEKGELGGEVKDRLGAVAASTAFNPQISLILDGVYYRDNRNGAITSWYEGLDGINHGHGEGGHSHGGAIDSGFNLRPTELIFSAAVDPWFDATVMATIDSEGGVTLEQAYVDAKRMPAGLSLRVGKFLSGIGYLNDKHPHQWDFVDQNLPYRTLLGEGLNDTGIQLTWLPPTGRLYTRLGVEAFQGNDQPYATSGVTLPTQRADGNPLAAGAAGGFTAKRAGPRLWTLFAKVSPELPQNHALLLGAWRAWSRQHQELHDHSAEEPAAYVHGLEGKSRLWGVEAVYKYDAPGSYGAGDWTVAAEYLRLVKDLRVAFHELPAQVGQPRTFTQDGFYVQALYGVAPRWQVGVRYDLSGLTNEVRLPVGKRAWDDSRRWSWVATYHFSEYSRLRLQWSRVNLAVDGDRHTGHEVWLQYQHSLGAHGAHTF